MKELSRPLAFLLTLALLLGVMTPATLAAPGDRYPYDQPGDKDFMTNTNVLERYSPTGTNNQSYKVAATRAQADATFTSEPIVVDGVREDAWNAAASYPISHTYNTTMTADLASGAQGNLRLLWDGPMLYILVEVSGDTHQSDSGTPSWSAASYTPTTDGLFVFMDVFNDQWGMETDTQGVFFLPANPAAPATSFSNGGIPSLGSFFNTGYQDYSSRLKAYKSSGYSDSGVNYTYEIALQIEGWGDAWEHQLTNGTKIGLELGIFDQGQSFTYWSKTQYFAGREGSSNLPNSERVRNRDWGEVSLADWDETTPFAYSAWRADEDIRFWDSKNNPGATGAANSGDNSLVWTEETRTRMTDARNAYNLIKDDDLATREEKEAAILEVCQAFAGLRWADTKYPDPHDLPELNTLPNVWEFFDSSKGANGMVTNAAEWAERKQEILDLAQFYEYGYKPQPGVDYTLSLLTNNYSGTGAPTITARITPTNVNFTGGVPQNVNITITLPTTGVPQGYRAPVSFGGGFTAYGIADIAFPNWGGDNRTDAGAWGNPNRTGTFYTIFPYSRNSTSADVSIEMANATAVSVYLDILEMAVAENASLNARIDPTRAVTKGFSINGKLAFVAAIYDERVKAVIAGGAGATGPANWRYNVQGQEYSFDTTSIFYNPGAESIIAHGTEGPGNSYRHNRVRETELFRHFMPYGHMYAQVDGSYGYGNYNRLPFDQSLLVATMAPDRAIIIDTNMNDYNDGAVTDNMSLQIAKSVYKALGVNGDNFVKFNNGNYVSSGDPHGAASATPEGHFLSDFFYGTQTLTSSEASRLNTDPYNLLVANGKTQTPYDYYWGGFNTITGGVDGIAGTDGWYYNTLSAPPQILINVQPAYWMDLLLGYAPAPKLSVKVSQVGSPSGELAYQWYSNTIAANTGGDPISGATFSSFTIPTGLEAGEYYYYVLIRSNSGAATVASDVSKVSVRTPAADAGLTSVAINITSSGVTRTYTGTQHPTEPLAYNIAVPYGTNLNNLTAANFTTVAHHTGAVVGSPVKFDSGARWEITITAENGIDAVTYTVYVSAPFVPVTSVTGVPSSIVLGTDLKLYDTGFGYIFNPLASVLPTNATNQTLSWSLSDTTYASLVDMPNGFFTARVLRLKGGAEAGDQIVLTATVTNGSDPSTNFTQNFTITVISQFVPVTDIIDVPTTGTVGNPLALTGTVTEADATNQTILWSVKTQGTTAAGAALSNGNELSTTGSGVVVVTATIVDGTTLTGMSRGTNFTKDFTITFPSSVKRLSDLTASAGALNPSFDPNTTAYQLTVPHTTAALTLTPVVEDANATVTVNGLDVASGHASQQIDLSIGDNPIEIVVTAQDGATLTYTVTVTRLQQEWKFFLPLIGK